MGVRIVAYQLEHEPAVKKFNDRMRAGGWHTPFSPSATPDWLPAGHHAKLFNQLFLAVDGEGEVRGGYILKHQEFWLRGESLSVANYAFPLSEGVVNKKYGMVGLSMILDAQRRQPRLFGLGLGGVDHPSARVMKGVGWKMIPVPFLFRVQRPSRFLRNISVLRTSPARRVLLNLLAWSGAGWVGHRAATMWLGRAATSSVTQMTIVSRFDETIEQVWTAGRAGYGFGAVRDASVVSTLYPPDDDRFLRLVITRGGNPIGWAVLLDTQMRNHRQFGDMRVGTIVDGFGTADDAYDILYHANAELARRGVDLVVTNQSAITWRRALKRLGFLAGPSNFVFTASKQLAADLGPLEDALDVTHVNRGDGDGPINL